MKKVRILTVVMIAIILFMTFVSAQEVTFYKETDKYGLVEINIRQPNLFERIFNLFTAYFQKTQVYTGEQVDIKDSLSILGGTCGIEYWEIFIVKGSIKTSLGDVHDEANKLEGCNWEVWVSFVTDETGTYSLESKWRRAGGSTQTTSGGNTLEVIPSTGIDCEWQSWLPRQSISHGFIKWREYKDMDISDNNPCDEYDTEYKTYCDVGYHISGSNVGDTIEDGVHTCISDETETPEDCKDISGTSDYCSSTQTGNRICLFENKVYECKDYGTKGKCWTIVKSCENQCSNGECIGDNTQTCTGEGRTCKIKCSENEINIGKLTCLLSTCCELKNSLSCSTNNGICRSSQICLDDESSIGKLDCFLGSQCCIKKEEQDINGTKIVQALQPSLTWDEWKEASPAMRIKTVCSVDENCQPYEDLTGLGKNYTVSCKQTSQIVTQLDSDYKAVCDSSWLKKIGLGLSWVGASGCIGAISLTAFCAVATGGICTIAAPVTIGICSATATVSFATLTGCSIFHEEGLSKGACIALPKQEGGGFCLSFAHEWLNPYTKTDNCQTNTIIFLAIILIGIIILIRIAG